MKVKWRLQIGGLHVMASVRQTNAGWSWIVLHCISPAAVGSNLEVLDIVFFSADN